MTASALLDRLASAWLSWMPAMSWQVAVLVAVVLVISALARKASAHFRYSLWCLVLVKLCLPPTLGCVTGIGHWVAVERPPAPLDWSSPLQLDGQQPPAIRLEDAAGGALSIETGEEATPTGRVPWPLIAFGVWGAGALAMAAVIGAQFVRLRRRLRGSRRAEDSRIRTMLDNARAALDVPRAVEVVTAPGLTSPILFGLFRPRIVLPAGVEKDLPDDLLAPIFFHELAHLRRCDLWVNWIQAILQAAYWFHPLVWLANVRLRQERELIVDDIVLSRPDGDREVYGASLLAILKHRTQSRILSLGYVGILERGSGMTHRLRLILDVNRRPTARLGGLAPVLLVVLGLILIPQASPQEQPKKGVDAPAADDGKARDLKNEDLGGARGLFHEGLQRYRAGDVEESIRIFEQAPRKFPGDNWAGCALGYLGEIQKRRGRYDEAIEALQKVLRDYPEARYGNNKVVASIAAYQLAMCYHAKGERDKAMKAYEEAAKKYPDAYPGDFDTGNRMARLTQAWMEAEERRKGGTMPGTDAARALFGDAVRQERAGDLDASIQLLTELAAQYPQDNWAGCALGYLGMLKMRQRKYDEAITAYERVIQEFPLARYGNGKLVASFAAYSIATCRYKMGEKEKAIAAFDEAVKKYPDTCTGDDDTGKRLADMFLEMIAREER